MMCAQAQWVHGVSQFEDLGAVPTKYWRFQMFMGRHSRLAENNIDAIPTLVVLVSLQRTESFSTVQA